MTPPTKNPIGSRSHHSVIRRLRGLSPDRLGSIAQAYIIAEKQATILRTLTNTDRPDFDAAEIEDLPRVDVRRTDQLRASGSTQWRNGAWRITIKQSEVAVRQRFTLAHEFKHVLDGPRQETLYRHLEGRWTENVRSRPCVTILPPAC